MDGTALLDDVANAGARRRAAFPARYPVPSLPVGDRVAIEFGSAHKGSGGSLGNMKHTTVLHLWHVGRGGKLGGLGNTADVSASTCHCCLCRPWSVGERVSPARVLAACERMCVMLCAKIFRGALVQYPDLRNPENDLEGSGIPGYYMY